jgi:cytoskeletal protein RodZ
VARASSLSYDVPVIIRRKLLPWQDNVGEFGDKFRKAREKKEISLDDVSNVTKISARMLRAIEEEHFDQLPGGVFNKGFIRAYAKHLGLNDEEAITDYLACLRQAQIDAHEVWEPEASKKPNTAQRAPERRRLVEPNRVPANELQQKSVQPKSVQPNSVQLNQVGPDKSTKKSQSPTQVEELPDLQLPRAEHVRPSQSAFSPRERETPWSILVITIIVIVLAGILWIRRSHTVRATALNPTPARLQTDTSAVPAPAPVPKVPLQTVNQPSTPAAAAPATSSPATSGVTPEKKAENDVTIRTFRPAVASSAAKSEVPLKLVIRAEETSWISVQADGQTVSQETLIAPAHASVSATHEIVARIGNAAGVTFLWHGQEIPANGGEAEVKTFVFDANGMRALTSAPTPAQ